MEMENQVLINKPSKLWLLALLLPALAIYFIFYSNSNKPLGYLSSDIKLNAYIKSGKLAGVAATIPFIKSASENYYLSLAVDLSRNDKFSPEEWVIKNIPVKPQKDWFSNLAFKTNAELKSPQKVRVVLSKKLISDNSYNEFIKGDDAVETNVSMTEQPLDEIFGSENTNLPEESMKQGTGDLSPQNAQSALSSVPDFRQRPAECAPTVAANGLYSLAFKNGAADKLPQNPQDMIDGLKEDLKWTFKNGVLPDDFVAGKNKYAVTHGLPIKTEKIGDKDGRGTLEDIKKALQNQAAVEMRIRFADENLKAVGGHIVSIVSVREVNRNTFIDIHDPASPTGTDTYEVSANEILNYPYHDGSTVIGWGFSQVWEGAPMGGQLEPMTEAELRAIREFAGEKKTIKALNVNGKYIPLTEVRIGKGEHCDGPKEQYPHWHSTNGIGVTATDGTKLPDNDGCGYGKEKDVPVVDVQVP